MSDRHQQKPYPLRMPSDLREKLEQVAADNGRSLNAEIVHRLQTTLANDDVASTIYSPTIKLTPGTEIDDAVRRRANALAKPENRGELQTLIAAILALRELDEDGEIKKASD